MCASMNSEALARTRWVCSFSRSVYMFLLPCQGFGSLDTDAFVVPTVYPCKSILDLSVKSPAFGPLFLADAHTQLEI